METKTYHFCIEDTTNEGATTSSFSFEEEVASLLLDMRDRIVKGKATEEVRQTDVRANSASNFEDACSTRKRKASFDEEDSLDEMEDGNDMEETDEPEWKHEEESLVEDDDEWLDLNTGLNSASNDAKTPRKKAPSGSACEKHKRWKKRCPEDCPMRKLKSSFKRRSDNGMDSDSSPPATPSPPMNRRPKKARLETESAMFRLSAYAAPVATGDLSFAKLCSPRSEQEKEEKRAARMSAEELPQMEKSPPNSQYLSGDEMSPLEDEDSCDIKDEYISSPEIKSARGSPKPKRTRNSAKSRASRKYLPQACDHHKLLHAKCPASCPDRLKRDADLANQPMIQHASEDVMSSSLNQ